MELPALIYHQASYDLIGHIPKVNSKAVDLLREYEQQGVRLPSALYEWYSLEQAIALLGFTGNHPQTLEAILSDLYSPTASHDSTADSHRQITILVEHAGYYACQVHLNGDEDPPVLMETEPDENKADVRWNRFSEFIFNMLWENFPYIFEGEQKTKTADEMQNEACMLCAFEDRLRDEDLDFLRTLFPVERKTSGVPAFYHFENHNGHVYIWRRNPNDVWWWLRSDKQSDLLRLVRAVLAGVGTLSQTLAGTSLWSSVCADSVLDALAENMHEFHESEDQ